MKEIEEIKKELLELNFDINSRGILYWIEAVKIIKKNPLIWDMMDIYEKTAKKYNTTYTAVERAMRHSMQSAIGNIQRKYEYYNKINNQTFLNLIRYKLI